MFALQWLFLFWSLGVGAANASGCVVDGHPYQLQSDIVEWQMRTRIGQSCRRGIRFKLISNPAIKVVSPPRFGTLTVQGPSFSYTAGPDFRDEDSFTIEVSGSKGKVTGSSTIRVAVSNIDAATPSPRALNLPPAPQAPLVENAAPRDASLPPCPIWDWSKGSPPPMRPPFDKSKLYCPPPPFNPPNSPTGCVCPE